MRNVQVKARTLRTYVVNIPLVHIHQKLEIAQENATKIAGLNKTLVCLVNNLEILHKKLGYFTT